ncbi:transposase [Candidatus Obscuribacterales bacterium]|nr:transposase [Candidatus Obscuribacterales bacterium]
MTDRATEGRKRFSITGARKAPLSEKRALIERGHEKFSVAIRELLDINRSTLYYKPRTEGADNATLRRLIDEQYLETPFYGSRRMTKHLRDLGHQVNRKGVQRLMRQMGIEAIYPKKKRTTIRNRAQDLSILAPQRGCYSPKSGLGCGHHLCAAETRIHVSGGHYRLVQPQGAAASSAVKFDHSSLGCSLGKLKI